MKVLRPHLRTFVAILLAAVVVCFAVQAAGHWHNHSYEDQHCRICHFAHSVAIAAAQAGTPAPLVAVSRLVTAPSVDPTLEPISYPFSSRAPPA